MASVKIIGKVAVKVMPDTSGFKQDLKRRLQTIEKSMGPVKINVIPVISAAEKKKLGAEMNALQRALDGKDVNFDLGINNKDLAAAEAALAALTRDRKVNIKAVVDDANIKKATGNLLMLGGARPQIDAVRKALEQLGNLDYIAISAGLLATKMTAIGTAALVASGQILSVGYGLGQMSAVLLAAPGLLGGLVVGLGVSAVAFKDFNKEVPQAAIYMEQLGNIISKNFWAQAGDNVRAFIDGVFPILKKNLAETSTALGTFFGALAKSLGTNLNPQLEVMFTNLNESIEIFTGYTDDIANLIAVLGEAGSEYLPRLATYFGDLTARAADFLGKAKEDGRLFTWIDNGITNLLALKDVLVNTGSIFKGFAEAANNAGAGGLPALAEGLGKISAAVNSSGFQSGMTKVFETSFGMMESISKQAGPGLRDMILSIADVFNKVGPGMGDTMGKSLGILFEALSGDNVSSGLISVFDGIQAAMAILAPSIQPVVDMFASLGPVIEALLVNVASIASAGTDRLAPTFTAIATAIVPVINMLGGLFTNVLNDLGPVFEQVGKNVVGVIGAFGPLIKAVQGLWNVIGPLLVPVLKIVVAIIGSALKGVVQGVTWVFEGLTKIVSGIIDVFTGFWDVLVGLFTLDFSKIGEGFKTMFGGLVQIVVGALQGVAGAIWAWLNGSLFAIFRTAGTKVMTTLFKPLGEALAKGIGVITGGLGKIKGAFVTGWNVIKTWWDDAMSGLYFLFAGVWDDIVRFLGGAWKGILNVIKNNFALAKAYVSDGLVYMRTRFDVIWNAIKKVVDVVWNTIPQAIRNGLTKAKNFVTSILNNIKSFFSGGWDSMVSKTKNAWTNMVSTIRDKFSAIKSKVQEIPGVIKGAVAGAATWLYDTGKKIIQGLIDGIGNMFGNVRGKLGELTGKLTQWKGPESLDKVLLVPAGKMIIDGFINGLESRYDAVRKSLGGLTSDVASQFGDQSYGIGINASASTAASGIASRVNGAGVEPTAASSGGIAIDNITIPLEDLAQLKTLEDFMNMLRVRTRMGVTG